MEPDELAFLPATEQARLIREGELSPSELVETYLERIERLDPALNAFVTVCCKEGVEPTPADGPFRGVPIPVKDLTETVGVRTTFSSRAFADYVPTMDTAVVRRLREAGFVLLGKSNTPEFGTTPVTESELNGPCRTPWDTSRNAGGSSGGAAVAVAAGLAPVAHGSDGGGSIRIPASCCGLFGLKPSRGRVSHSPYRGLAGLSSDGPIARTVADAAALLDVLAGYETGDPYWAPPPERPFVEEVEREPGRLRIALALEPPLDVPVDPACTRAARDAAELLSSLGHHVEEAAPAWRDDALVPLFIRIWQVGPALYPVPDAALLEPLNRTLAQAAAVTSSVEFVQALLQLNAYARRTVAFWDDYDLLLTPTLALPPVPVGWYYEDEDPWAQFMRGSLFTPFTPFANLTGQPAVSLPLHWAEDGLPIGVQLIGKPAGEGTLIRISAQLEQARPWADRRPPTI